MSPLSFVPPAIVGYRLERQIEGRLGGPRSIAAGLLAGAAGMAADARPQERGPGDAGPADGLALGVAQAAAARTWCVARRDTTAARFRRFTREHANLLSRTVALPVIIGATALKGSGCAVVGSAVSSAGRLRRRRDLVASTLASQRLISLVERDRALWPYAAYRLGLATAVVARMRRR